MGKIKSPRASLPLSSRLRTLQQKISEIFDSTDLSLNDVLVCEAPTTMKDPRAAFKVEQVRGLFETLARSRGVCVPGRIHPRSVQQNIIGLKGKQIKRELVKQSAVFVVSNLHSKGLARIGFKTDLDSLKKNQDIVDAILVGSLGLSWIQEADRGGFEIEEYFDQNTKASRAKQVFRRRVAA